MPDIQTSHLRAASAIGVLLAALWMPLSAAGRIYMPAPHGDFITAFAVKGPVSARRDTAVLGEALDGKGWRVVAAETDSLNLGKKARPRKGQSTWFGVILETQKPQDLLLKLGCDGRAVVSLDGAEIGRHDRNRGLLWDDTVLPFRLPAGRHVLKLRTTRRKKSHPRGWRLILRIHDAHTNQRPVGLTIRLPASGDVAPARARATTLHLDKALLPSGLQLSLRLVLTGAAPEGPEPAWAARLDGRPIAQGHIGDTQTVPLHHIKDGHHTLVITCAGRTWRRPFHFSAATNQALIAGRTALARAPRSASQAAVDSLTWNLDRLSQYVKDSIPDHTWLLAQARRIRAFAERLSRGEDPYTGPHGARGAFYRAYRSRYDGRLQHYSVHVPKRYDGRRKWPLVIGMHGIGSGSHYTLRRVLGKDRDREHGELGGKRLIRGNMPRLPDYGVLTATVWGYHDTAFWYYGEDDVMAVIAEMKAAYNIDPNRVYLTGLSLGGLGTYHIGLHFADQFAAIAPLGGFSSVKLYRQIRRFKKRWWERVLIEQRDATTYAENGRHTPMHVVHGAKDGPRQARAMTDRYDRLGYRYVLETPDLGHNVWQFAYGGGAMVKWLKRFVRPQDPDEIVFKTHSYRYLKAYWAAIGWMDDLLKPALLKLRVQRQDRHTIVIERLDNIRGFSLDLARPKLASGPIHIRLSGQSLVVAKHRETHFLRNDQGQWRIADHSTPPKSWKHPGVSGPLDDVMYDPQVFVVGTQDPAQTDTNRRLVDEDRRYLRHGSHDIWFPVVDDTALVDTPLTGRHLILYGNPRSNAVLARLQKTGALPVRFEDHALVVDGQRFEGDDVGVTYIFPNPLDPDHVVVVVAGVTSRGTLLSRYLPRHLPDIMVYDHRMATGYYTRILEGRPVLYANFFDARWRPLPPRP